MPPAHPHAPEGAAKALSPSPHVAALLDQLRALFRRAADHGFCPVAAAAYAAQQQPRPPHLRLPPARFQMRTHVAHAAPLCSCVATANAAANSHHHQDQHHQDQHHQDQHHQDQHHQDQHHQDQHHQEQHHQEHSPPPLACEQHARHSHHHHPRPAPQQRERRKRYTAAGGPSPADPTHSDLRKEMQNMDDAAKMTLMRHRMTSSSYKRSKTLELENNVRRLFEDQYRPMSTTGADLNPPADSADNQHMLGCIHYARRCKLRAKCCGLLVACRFCHDEAMAEDHDMDRFATETVLCIVCLTEQSVTSHCVNCKVEFAHHFCSECRFYENTPGKKVYHCNRCHICRLGQGLDIDNFHCDNCDACVSLDSKPYHRCTSNALHANCPVCRVYLFTSTEPVVFMRCGHTMHSKCFDDYTTGSYQCPLCMRSLTNMEKYFEQIDELVRTEPMPEEYDNKRSVISCCDCRTKSTVPYHFLYHKCADPACRSYNTNVLEVFDQPVATSASTSPVTAAASQQSSEYDASTFGSPFPPYADEQDGVAPAEDGSYAQPPIESTV